jgi:hypothetical protein
VPYEEAVEVVVLAAAETLGVAEFDGGYGAGGGPVQFYDVICGEAEKSFV